MKHEYPLTQQCRVLDCPRSSYYDRPQERDEQSLVAVIEAILMKWPFYGYRRLWAQLRREGLTVGERVARRILRQLGVSHSVGKVRVRTTYSNHTHLRYPNRIKDLDITRPDQVWVADITYIRLGTRFIYLAVILDAYTRAVRGWHLSRSLAQDLTVTALHHALEHGTPFIFHSDQKSEYAC